MEYQDKLDLLLEKSYGDLDMSWEEICEELELDVSPVTLRKSWLGCEFGGRAVYERLKDAQLDGYASDEQIEKFEKIKDEVFKERVKLQDANREKRNANREEARFENLLDVLAEKMELLPPIKLNDYKAPTKRDRVYATLMLSDWHYGIKVDHPWNYYDVETAKDRANQIVDKTIYHAKVHNITDLVVEINGDMVSGEINVSNKVASEEDIVEQINNVSELLAQCINKLKPHFESIKIVTTLGNHGRLSSLSKNTYNTKENFEMFIPSFLKLRLNMPIHASNGLDFTAYEQDGKFICVAHGQYDKLSSIVEDYSKIYKRVPDEIHIGHFHAFKDMDDVDVCVTGNGSLVGSDDFALQCRKTTKAAQTLIVYDIDRCAYQLKVD